MSNALPEEKLPDDEQNQEDIGRQIRQGQQSVCSLCLYLLFLFLHVIFCLFIFVSLF